MVFACSCGIGACPIVAKQLTSSLQSDSSSSGTNCVDTVPFASCSCEWVRDPQFREKVTWTRQNKIIKGIAKDFSDMFKRKIMKE